MNLSYRTKFEGKVETLQLKRNPLMHGLGYYEDQDGKQWDVICVYGNNDKPYINARPVDNSAYYSTATYGHQNGCHSWKPYYFEVIK